MHSFIITIIVQCLSILTIIVIYYAGLDFFNVASNLSKESAFTNLIKNC